MSNGNDMKRLPCEPEDYQGNRILITHYVSPQQFWYIGAKDVEASSALVRQMELKLVEHCNTGNQRGSYCENMEVIVRYLLWSPPKMLRGLIRKRKGEEYLVCALDYGFTINCTAKDLWMLPGHLNKKYYDVQLGGVAFIAPYNGSTWTKAALSVFGQKLDAAHLLYLDIRYLGHMNENFGTLWIKSSNCGQAVDAVVYLEEQRHGRKENSNMPPYLDPLSFDLAEINDVELKAGLRATKIMQLVAGSVERNALRVERNPFIQLSTSSHNQQQKRRSPPCPLKDPIKLDGLLQLRSEPPIPDAARRLSKVSGSGDTSVQTALIGGGSSKKKNVKDNVERTEPQLNSRLADQLSQLKLTSQPASMRERSPSKHSGLLATPEKTIISTNNQRSEPPSKPRDRLSTTARDTVTNILFKKDDVTAGKVVNEAMPTLFKKINVTLGKRVLTHFSKSVSVDKSEASLGKDIENVLHKLKHQTPLATQCFAWPHLMKGNSLLLVNASGTGRSWCYLPALCSLVMRSMQADGEYFKKKGPLAILLTESSGNAKALSKQCSFLMQDFETQFLKVVNTHDQSEPEVVSMLLGSCGILVTTLANLNALMDYKRKGLALFETARLKHIVLDDYDRMHQAAPQLLSEVMNRLRRSFPLPQMQFVLVAQCWHEQAFQKVLKCTSTNLLIFGDFLEAAMYGRVKLTIAVGQSKQKSAQLLEFLASQTQSPPQKRTIIFCNSQKEMTQLRKVLTEAGHECVTISKAQMQEPNQLLLVYDDTELQLLERNKELLVHFSLPELWTKFAKRFHVMNDCVQNRLAEPLTQQPPSIASYVMLDESNSHYGPSLMSFLKLHGLATDKLSEEMSQFLPKDENSLPLCVYLLKTGECTQRQCIMRHHFLKEDVQDSSNPCLKAGALVRCKPCKIYDPAHMALWPMEYMLEGTNVWVEAPFPVSQWMAEVELSGSSVKQHHPVRVSDVCLVHQQGLYKRVRVLDIPAEQLVTVQLMDHGTELMQMRPWDLLPCDAKFKGLPMLAVDVKLSCVEPTTGEAKWSPESLKWIHDTFYGLQDGQYIQITVDYSMLDVVHVKEIFLVEECPTLRTSVYRSVLRKELIARGFGKLTTKSLAQGPPAPLTCRGLASVREKDMPQMRKQVPTTFRKEVQVKEALADGLVALQAQKQPLGKTNCQSNPPTVGDPTPDKKKLSLPDGKDNDTLEAASSSILEEQKESLGKAVGQSNPPTVEGGSPQKLLEMLKAELANENSLSYPETLRFLQSIVGGDEGNLMAKTNSLESSPIRCLTNASSAASSVQEPSKDQAMKVLQGATTLGEPVAWPMVKWHQTLRHIELIFEQKVPEYELLVWGNFLSYLVTETSPTQRCFMNLLGEVRIVSEKQHGYYLHVKLSKVGSLFYWPTLLNSLYRQQHSHWLSYDVERAKEPPSPRGLLLWERHMRLAWTKDNSNMEEDSAEYDSVDSDLSDANVYDEGMMT